MSWGRNRAALLCALAMGLSLWGTSCTKPSLPHVSAPADPNSSKRLVMPPDTVWAQPCEEGHLWGGGKIIDELQAGRYEAVEAYFHGLQRGYEENVACEAQVWKAYSELYGDTKWWGDLAARWVEAHPGSYVANTAMGVQRQKLARERRGGGFIKDVSAERRAGMRQATDEALAHLSRAIELYPRGIAAYGYAHDTAKLIGDRETPVRVMRQLLEIDPINYGVRRRRQQALVPWWGGSWEQMKAEAAEAQKYIDRNPRLRVLLGMAFAQQATQAERDKQYERAVELYTRALANGFYGDWLSGRTRALLKLGDHLNAYRDAKHFLDRRPDSSEMLVQRARALSALGQYERARPDLARVEELSPDWGWAIRKAAWLHHNAKAWPDAERLYWRALEINEEDTWALRELSRVIVHGRDEPTRAEPLVRKWLALEPKEPRAWWFLGVVLAETHDARAVPAFESFLAQVDGRDPEWRERIKEVENYLARQPPSTSPAAMSN